MDPLPGPVSCWLSLVDFALASFVLACSSAGHSIYLGLFAGHPLSLLPHPVPAGTTHLDFRATCMGSEGADLRTTLLEIQSQLRALTLAVGRLAAAVDSQHHIPTQGAVAAASVAGGESSYRSPSVASSSASTSQVYNELALQIPAIPDHVAELASALRRGSVDSKERASRAWTIGYWARFTLEGRVSKPRPSPPIGLPNAVYVVIRAPAISSPTVCTKGSDYRALVGEFDNSTLSHGFPSAAEAKIYCAGANIPYPTTIYQWRP